MNDTFAILAGFLERFGHDVEGREVSELSPEAIAKLEQLARGTLPASDQAEIWALLNQNPRWLAWLADEVKSRRAPA